MAKAKSPLDIMNEADDVVDKKAKGKFPPKKQAAPLKNSKKFKKPALDPEDGAPTA